MNNVNVVPENTLVAFTLAQMDARLQAKIEAEPDGKVDVTRLRSGLLFMGNVHDAVPRRLLLDTRLSPLDKQAWMLIRLYAQQNQGAVFPTYDELQVQLASPFKGQASRETVSRVLLMLRLTGWLSLCRRVRDKSGRIRGNIYAQHDEPLGAFDAETLDPTWLETVAVVCESKNVTLQQTAFAVLDDVRNDPTMRHHHSQLGLIAQRLGMPQTPQDMAARLAHKRPKTQKKSRNTPDSASDFGLSPPSSETELSPEDIKLPPSSETEPSNNSVSYIDNAKPNCNVRSSSKSIKRTYIDSEAELLNKDGQGSGALQLPTTVSELLGVDDCKMITRQLQALPLGAALNVLAILDQTLTRGTLNNPVGWLLAMLKRAREGKVFPAYDSLTQPLVVDNPKSSRTPVRAKEDATLLLKQAVSQEQVRGFVDEIRKNMSKRKMDF
ncbi:helix-turn-helix domain-containing protein [Rouxiella badensis]|uniref:STY4528 family pathogenicity island replication protein n=1 Tax=Rouxiella badensis TaxID=1646377 RepID=UPI001D156A93|nr:STY4528 family pathogenicity island replication protein [Rouxiella badensis]MCC3705156.1 helix-turn-helix domain-containing protein [Rouxiella badensis]